LLAVITDRKGGNAASGTEIQWFDADVVSAQQYYPCSHEVNPSKNLPISQAQRTLSPSITSSIHGENPIPFWI